MKNLFERFQKTGLSSWKKPESPPSERETPVISKASAKPVYPVFPTNIFKDFLDVLSRKQRPVILDLGVLIGSNVEYFFNLGAKVHVEDLLSAYRSPKYWTVIEGQTLFDESAFLEENLDYPEGYLDGTICWDLLNYVEPKFARSLVHRITSIIKPGGYVLAFFHTQKHQGPAPGYKYRVLDDHNLEYLPLGVNLELVKLYQTRDITQLFSGYLGSKFCLLKHNILEVLLRRE
jgi:hypothetical protein